MTTIPQKNAAAYVRVSTTAQTQEGEPLQTQVIGRLVTATNRRA